MFGALKPGFRSLATTCSYRPSCSECCLKPKRTAAASHGFIVLVSWLALLDLPWAILNKKINEILTHLYCWPQFWVRARVRVLLLLFRGRGGNVCLFTSRGINNWIFITWSELSRRKMSFTALRTLWRPFRFRFVAKHFAVVQPSTRTYQARIGDYGYKCQSARAASPASGDYYFGNRLMLCIGICRVLRFPEHVFDDWNTEMMKSG